MSYCAFENTYSDLRQCLSMLYEARGKGMGLREFIESRSSTSEGRSVERLLIIAEELIEVANMMEAADDGDEDEADAERAEIELRTGFREEDMDI